MQAELTPPEEEHAAEAKDLLEVRKFSFWYGDKQVLHDLAFGVPRNRVTAIIGPSGCGKSTLLRSFNRMNDLIEGTRHAGDIRMAGKSLYTPERDVTGLRRRIGMIFQQSNPFPMSIYENVVFGLRIMGEKRKAILDELVESSLRGAALWDEVRDRLHESAFSLSGGQMQRLCIARTLANRPEVLLMDEPCSGLDPIATGKIEELFNQLKQRFTILIVTHNMQQAARVSDDTLFINQGRLIEYGPTESIFMNPENSQTEAYVSGRFG
ncbi:MAG: phosphate ABC transporter ATP-binding protein PstB [Opitutales bacterium]